MDLRELYQEIILDHGKNPRNKGICDNFNRNAKGHIHFVETKFIFI